MLPEDANLILLHTPYLLPKDKPRWVSPCFASPTDRDNNFLGKLWKLWN
jgi:hypothetical protein